MIVRIFVEVVSKTVLISILGVIILILRFIFRNLDKRFIGVLWILLLIRLCFPGFLSNDYSIVKDESIISIPVSFYRVIDSDSRYRVLLTGSILYFSVLSFLIIKMIISYLRVKKVFDNSVFTEDNVYLSADTEKSFVYGLVNPRIIISSDLSCSERDIIITHEKMHIKWKHHLIKFACYVLTIINWFNPLAWILFKTFSLDMEMATDARTIVALRESIEEGDLKKKYCELLLNCHIRNDGFINSFASSSGKRIERIMKTKKTKPVYIIVLVLMVIVVLALLSPKQPATEYRAYLYTNGYNTASLGLDSRDNSFSFTQSFLSDSFDTGHYSETRFLLVLKTDNGRQYSFLRFGNYLIFLQNRSSEIARFRFTPEDVDGEKAIKNFGVFVLEK